MKFTKIVIKLFENDDFYQNDFNLLGACSKQIELIGSSLSRKINYLISAFETVKIINCRDAILSVDCDHLEIINSGNKNIRLLEPCRLRTLIDKDDKMIGRDYSLFENLT